MQDEFEQEHSERGPSTAHRWILCPGSVKKSRGLPDEAGIEAARGTVFHEFAAICVQEGLDPQGFVGATMEVAPHGVIEFDQQMADCMQNGLDLIESYLTEDTILIVERKVGLQEWIGEGEFGTADVIIIDTKKRTIVCLDWKYGEGVVVHPINNDQAILYVLGAWTNIARPLFYDQIMEEDPTGFIESGASWEESVKVTIIIEQPRAPGGGGVWETDMGYLLSVGERIKEAAEATEAEDPPIVPGDKQCKFCKAAKYGKCRERAVWLMELAQVDLDLVEMAPEAPIELPDDVSVEARSRLLKHKTEIEAFLARLHAEAYKDAEIGNPVPMMKMVMGRRPPRRWKDENKAKPILMKRLGDEAFHEPKLLSPTEVEKAVGKRTYKEHYERHVNVGEAKPILVPDDAPGVPIKPALDYLPDPEDETLV